MAYIVAVRVTWDRAKNLVNQKNHGISFREASELFTSGVDYLSFSMITHSDYEDLSLPSAQSGVGWCWSSGLNETMMLFASFPRDGQLGRSELSFVGT